MNEITILSLTLIICVLILSLLKYERSRLSVNWDGDFREIKNMNLSDILIVISILIVVLFIISSTYKCQSNVSYKLLNQRKSILDCCENAYKHYSDSHKQCCKELARFDSLYLDKIIKDGK